MKWICGAWILASSLIAWADVQTQSVADAEVLATLASRSGLPIDNLKMLLANCDASQQSMYFCAYRDLVREELSLDQVIAVSKDAACKNNLQQDKLAWTSSRDVACKESAAEEFGGGSMGPTAQLTCMAAETQRVRGELEAKPRCKF